MLINVVGDSGAVESMAAREGISCIVQQSPAFKLRERLRHESLRKAKHMSVDIVVPCSLANSS